MNRLKCCLTLFFLSVFTTVFSQNYRDTVINEVRNVSFLLSRKDKEQYQITKEKILKLEEDYGYEVDLKLRLIEYSYLHKDLEFFKEQLEILVKNHGFTVAYMSGGESYSDALLKGELSPWFKAMYLKNHFIWLENNFDKQIDQRKLHDNQIKIEAIRSVVSKVNDTETLSDADKKTVDTKCNEVLFSTVSLLHDLCRKYDQFLTGKNFGIVQTSPFPNLHTNLKIKENIERTWLLFEPYITKSYLKHQTDYSEYVAFDAYSFIHFGYQKYGLLKKENLPLHMRGLIRDQVEIPIQNAFFTDKVKREMGWQ
ncbi:hypothetical protein FLJC2902T_09560 [Flavobacterium limnosediminis JC2902]|uniref:Uncharacterized protein n=1 Tax=Flavobacterium limnosediminis JC2902 TaxID=1341181 RepID=V6SR36_9FLAO|nr:hypothetical protein [Flavobacterium limnosediminis]ESU28924.1 hypothetical protein FLJC2902T_09560 [Flavobacterium limnosediminis JC2902]